MIRPAHGALGAGHEVQGLRQMTLVDGDELLAPLVEGFECACYRFTCAAVVRRERLDVGNGHHEWSPLQAVVGCGWISRMIGGVPDLLLDRPQTAGSIR